MTSLHSDSIKKRWGTLTLCEQMGNIGSEVGRSISSKDKESARDRALELFDFTITDSRWSGPRRKEIARARENYAESLAKKDVDSLSGLNKYFYHFALAARINK